MDQPDVLADRDWARETARLMFEVRAIKRLCTSYDAPWLLIAMQERWYKIGHLRARRAFLRDSPYFQPSLLTCGPWPEGIWCTRWGHRHRSVPIAAATQASLVFSASLLGTQHQTIPSKPPQYTPVSLWESSPPVHLITVPHIAPGPKPVFVVPSVQIVTEKSKPVKKRAVTLPWFYIILATAFLLTLLVGCLVNSNTSAPGTRQPVQAVSMVNECYSDTTQSTIVTTSITESTAASVSCLRQSMQQPKTISLGPGRYLLVRATLGTRMMIVNGRNQLIGLQPYLPGDIVVKYPRSGGDNWDMLSIDVPVGHVYTSSGLGFVAIELRSVQLSSLSSQLLQTMLRWSDNHYIILKTQTLPIALLALWWRMQY